MKNRIILVTGSTDGIGKHSALKFAEMGAHVIVHGRNEQKIYDTVNWIKDQTQSQIIDSIKADFSSLSEIRNMAKELHERYEKIDVLINNVGAQFHELQFADSGVELTFVVNHIAPFLLTSRTIDLVFNSDYKRIINVSSDMHFRTSQFNYEYIYGKERYDLYNYYCNSKLANVLFSYKLSRLLEQKGFTVLCITPGLTDTNLNPKRSPSIVKRAAPVKKGIISTIKAATSSSLQGEVGLYLNEDGEITITSQTSYDIQEQNKLWDMSEEIIREKFAKL